MAAAEERAREESARRKIEKEKNQLKVPEEEVIMLPQVTPDFAIIGKAKAYEVDEAAL